VPKHVGLMAPLFSTWSTSSWGIGEFPDLVALARWSAAAGFDREPGGGGPPPPPGSTA